MENGRKEEAEDKKVVGCNPCQGWHGNHCDDHLAAPAVKPALLLMLPLLAIMLIITLAVAANAIVAVATRKSLVTRP